MTNDEHTKAFIDVGSAINLAYDLQQDLSRAIAHIREGEDLKAGIGIMGMTSKLSEALVHLHGAKECLSKGGNND